MSPAMAARLADKLWDISDIEMPKEQWERDYAGEYSCAAIL
jgi:hypothetical protein